MKDKKIKWAFLISGWGRSALKGLEAFAQEQLPHAQIELLISEKVDSGALEKAKALNINCRVCNRQGFPSQEKFQEELREILLEHQIDYVFLLGFNHIIKKAFINYFPHRIINIHPSLLPSFKGLNAIQRAMEYGVKVTGLTTHIIDEKLDEGIILFQEPLRIEKKESFENIDQRFLQAGEKLIAKTINYLSEKHGEPCNFS